MTFILIESITTFLTGLIRKPTNDVAVHEQAQPRYLEPSTYILRKRYFADGVVRYMIEYSQSGRVEHLTGCDNDESAKILYDDFCGRHQRLADSMKVEKEEILK